MIDQRGLQSQLTCDGRLADAAFPAGNDDDVLDPSDL
jgi:hypothetical protein